MESPLVIANVVCPRCGVSAEAAADRCSRCGAALAPARQAVPARPGGMQSVIDSRWQLLLLLFGATGVLGLPWLMMSRAFGPLGKLVVGLLVTLWTLVLASLVCWSWMWTLSRWSEYR